MIKTIVFVKRRSGTSFYQFCRYWLETHAAITTELPGLRSLQFNLVRPEYQRGQTDWDGVSCAIFENEHAMGLAARSEAFQEMLADEENFVDTSRRSPLIVDPLARMGTMPTRPGGSAETVKSMTPVWRQPGVTRESFAHYWREAHGKLLCNLPHLRALVQNTPRLRSMRHTPWCDGVAESWWDTYQGLQQAFQSPAYQSLEQDERRFLDLTRGNPLIVREVQIVSEGKLVF